MRSPWQFSRTLWSKDKNKDKDLWSKDKGKDKYLRSEDKDKDKTLLGLRTRTRTSTWGPRSRTWTCKLLVLEDTRGRGLSPRTTTLYSSSCLWNQLTASASFRHPHPNHSPSPISPTIDWFLFSIIATFIVRRSFSFSLLAQKSNQPFSEILPIIPQTAGTINLPDCLHRLQIDCFDF